MFTRTLIFYCNNFITILWFLLLLLHIILFAFIGCPLRPLKAHFIYFVCICVFLNCYITSNQSVYLMVEINTNACGCCLAGTTTVMPFCHLLLHFWLDCVLCESKNLIDNSICELISAASGQIASKNLIRAFGSHLFQLNEVSTHQNGRWPPQNISIQHFGQLEIALAQTSALKYREILLIRLKIEFTLSASA